MENPWLNVSLEKPYAACDKDIIFDPKYKDIIQINGTMPEPYSGNRKANVVFLNLNPGNASFCFENNKQLEEETKKTLNHETNYSMWLDRDIMNAVFAKCIHPGCKWWRTRTNELRKAISPKKIDFFVIEYFPYHSEKSFVYPELGSDKYRDFLLKEAIENEKLLVIMRGENKWMKLIEKIKNDCKIDNIDIIRIKNRRSPYISKGNMDPHEWEKLIEKIAK